MQKLKTHYKQKNSEVSLRPHYCHHGKYHSTLIKQNNDFENAVSHQVSTGEQI